MKELKLGKVSSKEIASWLGLSYSTYKNRINYYLERLEAYCDFNKVYGGIEITNIYMYVYNKNLDKEDDLKYIDQLNKTGTGLATISGMSQNLIHYDQDFKEASLRTIQRRMSNSGKRLFGQTNGAFSGLVGNRNYVWAIKRQGYNKYRYLTDEEEKIFNEILSNYYKTEVEKIKAEAILEYRLEKREIDQDEFFSLKKELNLNNFVKCLELFRDKTSETIVLATQHSLGAFRYGPELTEDEEVYAKKMKNLVTFK